jgi:excisionase family DNA binding protein
MFTKSVLRGMKTRILEVAQPLNAQQTATLLSRHVKTLYEWTREGRIGCFRTGRNLKFHPQHLQEYFDRQSRG